MKILLDMNLSPDWVGFLQAEGFETLHWRDVGDPGASDADIMAWASRNDHVVFTHDLDFSALLAATQASFRTERDPGQNSGHSAGCDRSRHRARTALAA